MKEQKFTKREFLKVGSAVAAGSTLGIKLSDAQGFQLAGAHTSTIFSQGALGGGGYVKDIDISPDGTTRLISTDVANGWVFNITKSKWENVLSYSRVPASYKKLGSSRNCWAIRCAPSLPSRVYMVSIGSVESPSAIWRSDDRCQTWMDTGYSVGADTESNGPGRGQGPFIAIDPNNPDVVYIADVAGVIHRSFDGGATWGIISELTSALISLTTSPRASNGKTLNFSSVPSSLNNRGKYIVYAYDVTNPNATIGALRIATATSTTIGLSSPLNRTVSAGDRMVFGSFGSIAFDPSSRTSGGKTNTIYVGFGYGAAGIYRSTDAGATWSLMTGSPTQVFRLHCSIDGALYAIDLTGWGGSGGTGTRATLQGNATNAWKYQSGTWTNFAITAATGNVWHGVASDPNNPGTVVFINMAGNIIMSTDYGVTWSAKGGVNPRLAADVPWLATTGEKWQSNGAIAFDPVVPNRMWVVEGIGIWYCTPTVATPTSTLTSQTIGNNELILTTVKKTPGGPLLISCWDRGGFVLSSPTTYPKSDINTLVSRGFAHGWDVDYAKTNASFCAIIINSQIYTSPDRGASWTQRTTPPNTNWGGAIAVQTPTNFVVFPSNNGVPSYTNDGGETWSHCLFNGFPLRYGWAFAYFLSRHIVCCDLVNRSTYYCINYDIGKSGADFISIASGGGGYNVNDTIILASSPGMSLATTIIVTSVSAGAVTGVSVTERGSYQTPPSNPISQTSTSGTGTGATFNARWGSTFGGVWRSTDGGANWSQMTTANPNRGNANRNTTIVAVPGYEGHLFLGSGVPNLFPAYRSVDGGATWYSINGTFNKCQGLQVACGKAAPGKVYPSIYLIGNLSGASLTANPVGLYQCDDCTADPSVAMTWKLLSHSPCDMLDVPTALSADPDVYGSIYIAFGATGYGYGKLAS